MKLAGSLNFEGRNCLAWIKRNEEDQVEILFNGDEELDLTFDPPCFERLKVMLSAFISGGENETVKNSDESGSIISDVWFSLEDDRKIMLNSTLCEIREDAGVSIHLETKRDKIEILMSMFQVRQLAERLQKIIKIEDLEKEVQTKETIETSPTTP